jgi:hypothetical protein
VGKVVFLIDFKKCFYLWSPKVLGDKAPYFCFNPKNVHTQTILRDTTIILCEQHAKFICIFHDNTFYSSSEEIPTNEGGGEGLKQKYGALSPSTFGLHK